MDSQARQDHDGFVYLYSLVHMDPIVKGQGQNTWNRHCPQPQGAPTEAGVQMPSGLALPQPNLQSLCGKNKNKEKKQLLTLGLMVFLPFDSMNTPEKCALKGCFRLG